LRKLAPGGGGDSTGTSSWWPATEARAPGDQRTHATKPGGGVSSGKPVRRAPAPASGAPTRPASGSSAVPPHPADGVSASGGQRLRAKPAPLRGPAALRLAGLGRLRSKRGAYNKESQGAGTQRCGEPEAGLSSGLWAFGCTGLGRWLVWLT
jgi:hypothetical protein